MSSLSRKSTETEKNGTLHKIGIAISIMSYTVITNDMAVNMFDITVTCIIICNCHDSSHNFRCHNSLVTWFVVVKILRMKVVVMTVAMRLMLA